MRAGAGLALAALLLAGCAKAELPLQKAERNYAFLRSHGGSIAELCAAAEQGKTAAVEEKDELAYATWQNRSIQHCRLEMR